MAIAAALHLARRSAASTGRCLFRLDCSPTFFCKSPNYHYLHLLYFSTNKPDPNTSPSFPPDFFVKKFHFSAEIASKVASFSARMKTPQNAELVLTFLKEKDFSHSHLERIVRHYPYLLSACVETNVKPKFKIFEDLGLSAGEAAQLVSRDFSILSRGANTTIRSLYVLKDLLGSNDNVIKLIKKRPGLFYADPEKTLLPNIEFLKSCGVQVQQINSMMHSCPSLFFISPENMRRFVCKADEMGIERSSRMFILAVYSVSKMSAEALELKLKSFKDLGFSQDDILRMFRNDPMAIVVSTSKIKAVKEVLLGTGKYDMSCIIKFPGSLTKSVEKRYRPRLQVLKVLESKSLITGWPTLSTLCSMTDKRFFDRFVAPNINEVGESFRAKLG